MVRVYFLKHMYCLFEFFFFFFTGVVFIEYSLFASTYSRLEKLTLTICIIIMTYLAKLKIGAPQLLC